MTAYRRARRLAPWTLGTLEVLTVMALAVWVLTLPAVFGLSYRALHISTHPKDAVTIVQWLSSTKRERTLHLTLEDRHLSVKELRHFSDVRRVFRWLPRAAGVLALLTALLFLASTGDSRRKAQWRGTLLWSVLLLLVGGLALWDWKTFFSWAHRPFFGDRSWRLPNDSYSLELFPAMFWRGAAAAVLLAPGIVLGVIAVFLKIFTSSSAIDAATSNHPYAPAEKRPTTP